jgi:hypothetical protein
LVEVAELQQKTAEKCYIFLFFKKLAIGFRALIW